MAPRLRLSLGFRLHRRDRRRLVVRLRGADDLEPGPPRAGPVVPARARAAVLSHAAGQRPAHGDLRDARLRPRAAFLARRASGVSAGAGAYRAVLCLGRGDRLSDPAVCAVQPAQADPARHARRDADDPPPERRAHRPRSVAALAARTEAVPPTT